MKKFHQNSARASILQITLLLAVMGVVAILFASNFRAAPTMQSKMEQAKAEIKDRIAAAVLAEAKRCANIAAKVGNELPNGSEGAKAAYRILDQIMRGK